MAAGARPLCRHLMVLLDPSAVPPAFRQGTRNVDRVHDALHIVGILQFELNATDVAVEIEELLRDMQRHVAACSGGVGPQCGHEGEVLRQDGDVVESLRTFFLLGIFGYLAHLADELVHAVGGMYDECVANFRADLLRKFIAEDDGVALEVKLARLDMLGELLQQRVVLVVGHADHTDTLQIAGVFDHNDPFSHWHGRHDFGALSEGFPQLAPINGFWAAGFTFVCTHRLHHRMRLKADEHLPELALPAAEHRHHKYQHTDAKHDAEHRDHGDDRDERTRGP